MTESALHAPLPRPPEGALRGLWSLMRDPLGYPLELVRRVGTPAQLPFLGLRVVMVARADLAEQVLLTQHDKFEKDFFTHTLSELLGNGLLVSEGAYWRKQRRLIQPVFHPKRLEAYAGAMSSEALSLSQRLARAPGAHDVRRATLELSLRIVSRTLFGTDISAADARTVEHALAVVMERYLGVLGTGYALPAWLPTRINRSFVRVRRELDALIFSLIDRRTRAAAHAARAAVTADASAAAPGDLLDRLLEVRDDEGEPMTRQQLRDECLTLFLAGHETTALNLTYALWLLALHPQAQAALHEELDRVLGRELPRHAHLTQLPMTRAVISEALRLYPPAWAIGREAKTPVVLDGRTLSAGTQIWVMTYVMHRDAAHFPQPDRFIPERWLDGLEKRLPRHAFIPFGGGPRICIGNGFALTSATLALATLAQRLRFTPAATTPRRLELVPTITLRPAKPLPLDIRQRG